MKINWTAATALAVSGATLVAGLLTGFFSSHGDVAGAMALAAAVIHALLPQAVGAAALPAPAPKIEL